MNIADLIIIILLISSIIRGAQSGSLRQIFSTLGFFGGLFLGAWIGPHLVHFAHSASSRSWWTLGVTLGFALLLLGIGEYVGNILKTKLSHNRLDKVDGWLGSLVGAITLLAFTWLGAATLVSLPFPGLQNEIRGSAIIGLLDKHLPATPNVIADLSHFIDPNGFPKVFNGNEPIVNQNAALPNLGILTAAVHKDEASVVKIEGDGCGGVVEGSGFVASPGIVVTNAHVVAGVSHPYVLDSNGQHRTNVIWFDPDLDLAVLTVSNLAGQPLALNNTTVSNGTDAAVLGYPGGGDFNAAPAVVLDQFTAIGQNIYDEGNTSRSVYEVKANVIPGNSGGPLVNTSGAVVGIVFAESTTYNQVGYALTMQQVITELHQAESRNQVASTGACAE